MPTLPDDFTSIIERAQQVTGDISSMFGTPNGPGRVAFEAPPNRAGPDSNYEAHCEVFALPGDCTAYENVMNRVLRGEAIMRYEDRTFSKEGDFLVALVYLTRRERPAPVDNRDAGDAEYVERPHRIP
jgi:hypothetical protein